MLSIELSRSWALGAAMAGCGDDEGGRNESSVDEEESGWVYKEGVRASQDTQALSAVSPTPTTHRSERKKGPPSAQNVPSIPLTQQRRRCLIGSLGQVLGYYVGLRVTAPGTYPHCPSSSLSIHHDHQPPPHRHLRGSLSLPSVLSHSLSFTLHLCRSGTENQPIIS